MKISFKRIWNDYGIGAIIVLLLVAYGASLLIKNLNSKGKSGNESMHQNMNAAYNNSQVQNNSVQPVNL